MRISGLPWLLAIILLPAGSPAQEDATTAPEPSPLAVIHEASGPVFITKAGDPAGLPAEEDMELGPGDRITTGANGSVIITLRDDHFIKLGSQAGLTVKELRSDQVAGGIWARLILTRGKLMAVVASLTTADSRFEVDTPQAVASVKGTSFQVVAERKSTTISVLEGTVAASGYREELVAPEELEVKEGFETVVGAKNRRPGPLTKFFNNEKRKKTRVALSEYRAMALKLRARGQSGELRRQRRLRVLSRTMLIERFQKKTPASYKALPEWRRNRIDQFMAGHKPELDASRAEISRFLNSNPKTRKLLEQQIRRRFAGVTAKTPRQPGIRAVGQGKAARPGKQQPAKGGD